MKILAAADLHGNLDIARRLSEKAKDNKVDLVVLAGDIQGAFKGDEKILQPFKDRNQKVLFVPGNWETPEETYLLKRLAKNIHNYYVSYGDVGIAGIGSENWGLGLTKKDLTEVEANFKRMKPSKKVLVSHLHAGGTRAEFSGIPGEGELRKFIEKNKPDLFISAHIHEAEGIEEKIGKTRVIQVGRRGKIIEI